MRRCEKQFINCQNSSVCFFEVFLFIPVSNALLFFQEVVNSFKFESIADYFEELQPLEEEFSELANAPARNYPFVPQDRKNFSTLFCETVY